MIFYLCYFNVNKCIYTDILDNDYDWEYLHFMDSAEISGNKLLVTGWYPDPENCSATEARNLYLWDELKMWEAV